MLNLPLRDTDENVIPHNHDQILNDHYLIRGVSRDHIKEGRVSSAAFKSSSDPYKGLSVDLEIMTSEDKYLNKKYLGAVKFKAKHPRAKDLLVGYDPLSDNNAHCQLWRYNDGVSKNITSGQARFISRNCNWYIAIKDVELPS